MLDLHQADREVRVLVQDTKWIYIYLYHSVVDPVLGAFSSELDPSACGRGHTEGRAEVRDQQMLSSLNLGLQ